MLFLDQGLEVLNTNSGSHEKGIFPKQFWIKIYSRIIATENKY